MRPLPRDQEMLTDVLRTLEELLEQIMVPTGMTIILTVLIAMSFCVVLVMCINCFLGTCAECEANQRRKRRQQRRHEAAFIQDPQLKFATISQDVVLVA